MIVAVAAKDASYRRRVCITEAGDVGKPELATLLHEGRKTIQYYRFYYRPGVGIEDIVYRKPRLLSKTEYLLNGQRQLAGLFGYIETSEPVAEQYFKELINHTPPILKEINVQFRGKPRYVIADPSLREFVLDCIGIIDYTRIRMDNAWIHGEWLYGKPLTKSLSNGYVKWHTNLYGAERIEARYFAYLDTKREKFKTKDFMTQSITINTVKKSNEHCERSIRYHYEKLNGKRFESLRNEYGCITKPLLKLVETCLPLVSVPHERLVA